MKLLLKYIKIKIYPGELGERGKYIWFPSTPGKCVFDLKEYNKLVTKLI